MKKVEKELQSTTVLQTGSIYEYLSGKRTKFDLPFSFEIGTEFMQSVWKALTKVPYGITASYKDGALAGFSCGMNLKKKLLKLEGENL